MPINLRNALMAGRRLPYDAEVEYLESTGTQWIDTGVVPTNTTGVKITHTVCTGNSRDNILFGARQNNSDTRYWEDVDWTNATIGWGFGKYIPALVTNRFSILGKGGYIVTSSLNFLNDRYVKVDNVVYDSISATTLPQITYSIYLFGGNNWGSFDYPNKCRVYSCQISVDSLLVRDFIPVRVGTVGYLYDRVSGTLFGNAGTGAFTCGNDLKYPTRRSR